MAASLEERQLLLSICRCPLVPAALAGQNDACLPVVGTQGRDPAEQRQVPEPWNGHLVDAPILFLSSNPGFSKNEVFPKAPPVGAAAGSWSDDEIVEFFHGRFDPRPDGPFIQAGTRTKMAAGTAAYSGGVAFLEAARQRARDLLQRPPVPGVDYCLTEVVHCKSKTEAVAKPAATPCAEKWLGYILRLSGARVIVCFGGLAATALGGLPDTGLGEVKPGTVESATIGGRERRVVFLPHPNAFTKRTFEILADGELEWLRASLRR